MVGNTGRVDEQDGLFLQKWFLAADLENKRAIVFSLLRLDHHTHILSHMFTADTIVLLHTRKLH